MGNQDDNLLELLDFYMDMVEKQDEIIYRMGKSLPDRQLILNSCRMTVNFRMKSWKRIWRLPRKSWNSIRKQELN